MIVWCEACGKREAWSNNLKHPICAECAVLAWQKLSDDAKASQQSEQSDILTTCEKCGVYHSIYSQC